MPQQLTSRRGAHQHPTGRSGLRRVARPRPRRYRLRRLTARTEGSMVQFRKSKKVGPFRFTLTNRGVSSSVGAGPFRLSKGADGKLRRTIRVPGAGLYDTKVIGQPPQRRAAQTPRAAAMPSGWHADATDAPAAAPSARRRRVWPWVVGALIVLWLITTANSCVDGHTDANSRSVGASTVTRTVTVTPQPTTVTVTQAAPSPPSTAGLLEPPASSDPGYAPPAASSVYYDNCAAARADGAAPLVSGEPGYRPGLDRDGDGIACES